MSVPVVREGARGTASGREALDGGAPLSAEEESTPRWLERSLQVGLSLWVAGALSTEALASAGAAVTLMALLVFRCSLFRSSRRGLSSSRERALDAEARTGSDAAQARTALTSAWSGQNDVRAWLWQWTPLWLFLLWGLFVTLVHWPLRGSGPLARHLDWLGVPVAAAAALHLRGARWRPVLLTGAVFLLIGCLAAGLQYFGLWPRPEALSSLAWTKATVHRLYEPIPGAEGRYMGVGIHLHRLKFAHAGGIAVLWAFVLGLSGRGVGRRVALAVAGSGLVSILVFPHARAAALALCIGLLIAVWRRPSRSRLHRRALLAASVGLAALLSCVLLLQDSFRNRLLASVSGEGSGERMLLLQAGLEAVRAHPLLGMGIGRFRVGEWVPSTEGASEHVRSHSGKAHNLLLTTAAETGLVGLALFLVLIVWIVRQLDTSVAGTAGLVTVGFLLVLGLVHDPLHHAEVSFGSALALGVAIGRTKGGDR